VAITKTLHAVYLQWTGNNVTQAREFAGDEFLAVTEGDESTAELIIRFRDIHYLQRVMPGGYLLRFDGDDHIRVTSASSFNELFDLLDNRHGEVVTKSLQVRFTQWNGVNVEEVREITGEYFLAVVGAGTDAAEIILRSASGVLQRVHHNWCIVKYNDSVSVKTLAYFSATYDVLGDISDRWEHELQHSGLMSTYTPRV
jgi:hypothetical protein